MLHHRPLKRVYIYIYIFLLSVVSSSIRKYVRGMVIQSSLMQIVVVRLGRPWQRITSSGFGPPPLPNLLQHFLPPTYAVQSLTL